MNSLPRIRSGLLRHTLDQQVLVYDGRDDVVHLLDPTTACVLELLEEGGWTAEGITAEVGSRLNVEPNPGFLLLALAELQKADLLADTKEVVPGTEGVNRREVMRTLIAAGVAGVLVPTVATLTATKAYAQTSPRGLTRGCTTGGQCISGNCCGSPGICATSCPQPAGQRCTNDSQCVAGTTCSSADGFCVGLLANCQRCTTGSECAGGACNNKGACCSNCSGNDPVGEPCSSGNTCCSGVCTAGHCA